MREWRSLCCGTWRAARLVEGGDPCYGEQTAGLPRGASSPRYALGGRLVAVVVGTAFSLLYASPAHSELATAPHLLVDVLAVLSVGLSILIMVFTDIQHPPAAGTALGLAVGGWFPLAIVIVLVGAVMLSVVHQFLRPRLVNLF